MAADEHYLKRELYSRVRESPAIFEFLQLGAIDGLWYWDLEHPEYEWMSSRFWEVLGYDPATKQHLAAEWQDIIFPEDLAMAVENFEKHCADPSHSYDQVVRYRHSNGSTVWVRCRGVAIRDESGKPLRLLGAHNDITEQKRTEADLRVRTTELEAANAQLRSAVERIQSLEGLLPICMHCKKIRDTSDAWHQLESYISSHTGAQFSHGLCPECETLHYKRSG